MRYVRVRTLSLPPQQRRVSLCVTTYPFSIHLPKIHRRERSTFFRQRRCLEIGAVLTRIYGGGRTVPRRDYIRRRYACRCSPCCEDTCGSACHESDMLHAGILPHHAAWSRLFSNLRYVVIDELHMYRGVFGSHLANVIRRLKGLLRFMDHRLLLLWLRRRLGIRWSMPPE